MFPHTVTVYTLETVTDPITLKETVTPHITVLRGVLLDAENRDTVSTQGHEGNDAATLYIPFSVESVDGLTGENKQYAEPVAFGEAEEKGGLWTLTLGGNTFFLKGEVVDTEHPPDELEWRYPDAYCVTRVHTRDYGTPDMHHWEVGGN